MEARQERFRRLLPRSSDPVTVVLKVHLLAEERLDWVLCELARSPRALDDARLSFHQKVKLCNALLGDIGHRGVWPFFKALNKLRNNLSHNAEVPDVEPRIDAVVQTLIPKERIPSRTRDECLDALKSAAMLSCAYVEGVASETVRTSRAASQVGRRRSP